MLLQVRHPTNDRVNEIDQDLFNCKIGIDYPEPIVDHGLQVKKAKQILYGIKKTEGARVEAKKVYLKHGSRRRPLSKRVPTN